MAVDASTDGLLDILAAAEGADAEVAGIIVDALVERWPEGNAPAWDESDRDRLKAVYQAVPALSDRLQALAEKWGQADLFASQ
jgi:hypothetical protein